MKFGMAYKNGVRGRMSTLIDNEYQGIDNKLISIAEVQARAIFSLQVDSEKVYPRVEHWEHTDTKLIYSCDPETDQADAEDRLK